MIEEIRGDMFKPPSSVQIMVNTVNCVGVMGKGVALAFKQRYPAMFVDYKKFCDAGKLKPGDIWAWDEIGTPLILSFATKDHWMHSSQYNWIYTGLKTLREYLNGLNSEYRRMTLPALGCGNGGLEWSKVRPMIYDMLDACSIEIYLYPPN